MTLETFPIDRDDIDFVLFDQLDLPGLLRLDAFASVTADQVRAVLDESCRFARAEVWPTNAPADREGCSFDGKEVRVPACYHKLSRLYGENGWIALTAPEELGGLGMPNLVGIAAGEILCGASVTFSIFPGLTRGVARLVHDAGEEWMKEAFVRPLYAGEWMGTMCITEPQAGTAVGDVRTTATRQGDEYLVSGNKLFISGGDHDLTPNIVHLVLARTPGAPKGIKGLSLFVVPKVWVERDGSTGAPNDVACAGLEEKIGIHGSPTCALTFGENGRCRGLLLGKEGDGIKIMFDLMNEARIGTGLQGLAAAGVAYLHALDYARERVQGVEVQNLRDPDAPRVPIIRHPDVKRMLLTMKARVEGMRALLYRAAMYADVAERHPDAAARERAGKRLEILTPVCKAWCSDTGFDVTVTAVQVYGGYGATRAYPVEQLLRDVKISSIYEGANGIQALDLVGRKLGKNAGELLLALLDDIGGLVEANRRHPLLGDLAGRLEKETGRVREVAMRFAIESMGGNIQFPVMNATPFLAMMGNLVAGWLLLEQAAIAHDRLSSLCLERGVAAKEERDRLVQESPRARYLANKIETASFFVRNMLPANAGLAESILGGTTDALAAEL